MDIISKKNICAIVILYNINPKKNKIIQQLKDNKIFTIVVDNSDHYIHNSDTISDIYIYNGKNLGIARAQNVGIRKGLLLGEKGFLIFDQDSVISEDYIKNMILVANRVPSKVGIISPNVLDTNTGEFTNPRSYSRNFSKIKIQNKKKYFEDNVFYAAKPIASGQFIFADVFNTIGLMRDDFFIDAVDTEFNLRALLYGFDSIVVENIIMNHKIGNKRKINLGLISITPSNHNSFRKYYLIKNNILLLKKYKKSFKGLSKEVLLTVCSQLVYILFENQKKSKLQNALKGIFDGITKK